MVQLSITQHFRCSRTALQSRLGGHVVSTCAALYFCLNTSNFTLRCIKRLLHLTAKHFIKSITPLPHNTCDTSGGDHASDDDGNKDDEDIDSSDSLRKAITFMKQVSSITIIFSHNFIHHHLHSLVLTARTRTYPALLTIPSSNTKGCDYNAMVIDYA